MVHHPDALEDRLIEFAAHLIAGGAIHLVRIAQQFQPTLEIVGSSADVVIDGGEPGLKSCPLPLDLGDLLACLGPSQPAVSDEVDEVIRSGLQARDLSLDLLAQLALGSRLILQCVINLPINPFDELGTELHGPVVLDDLILDKIEGEVARVTDLFLLSSAEEVEVLSAESSDGALDQHPLVDQSTLRVALAAPERALEVVRINPLTLPGAPRCFESLLDADEQVAVDDGGVASLKGLALVDDVTDVVRVAQHCRDLRAGDRPCWSASCSARFQSAIGQHVSDVLHRELALVEEIECQLDERCAFFVDRDTAKLTAFDAFESVDVADGRFPERSAVLCFLPHLVRDVRSVFAGSVLVERREDPMHELPDRGRIDRLRG